MTKNEVIMAVAKTGRKGGFFGFETETMPKLTAKNRTTGEKTNFSVKIHKTFSAMLGVNYEQAVIRKMEKDGIENPTFTAQAPKGKRYVGGSKWLMTNDDGTKFYVAMDCVGGVKSDYFIDGRKATDEEVEDLKANYLPKVYPSKIAGSWRTYGVDSIVAIH